MTDESFGAKQYKVYTLLRKILMTDMQSSHILTQ